MKSIHRILLVLTVLLIATTLHAQTVGGCDDSPEDPTVVLALVGTAGALLGVARSRWAARRSKDGK